MDENVAHTDDAAPRHVGVPRLEFLRQVADSLTADLEMPDNPDLDELIGVEDLTTGARVAFDAFDGFQHVG